MSAVDLDLNVDLTIKTALRLAEIAEEVAQTEYRGRGLVHRFRAELDVFAQALDRDEDLSD